LEPWDFLFGNGAASASTASSTRRERAIKGTTHDEAFA
jgi:hypothetical protein